MLSLWFYINTLMWPITFDVIGMNLSLNVITLFFIAISVITRRKYINKYTLLFIIFSTFLLIINCATLLFGICEDGFLKSIITAPIFLFLMLIGLMIGLNSTDHEWDDLYKVSFVILVIILLEIVIEEIFFQVSGAREQGQFSGFYREPSHVAISVMPSLALLLISRRKYYFNAGIILSVAMLLLTRSSTLIALLMALILYLIYINGLKYRIKIIFLTGLIIILSFLYNNSIVEPFLLRFNGVLNSEEVINLSSLSYLQGWQDAWENMIRTNGIGLGFNMMGCNPLPNVEARDLLSNFQIELNTMDGSFLLSKIISEFGFIGLVTYILVVFYILKTAKRLRNNFYGRYNEPMRIINILLFINSLTMIVRGGGYFGITILLLIVCISAAIKYQNLLQDENNN